MKKIINLLVGLCIMFSLASCQTNKVSGTATYHISTYEWGCTISNIILDLDSKIDQVNASDFSVKQTGFAEKYVTYMREVTDAYLCDEEGNKVEEASQYVMLELYCYPYSNGALASVDSYYQLYEYHFNITLTDESTLSANGGIVSNIDIEFNPTSYTTDADVFEYSTYNDQDGTTYNYASYDNDSDTLIVLLHGYSEGGTDSYIPVLSYGIDNLIKDNFASLLIPQCPTYWSDTDYDYTESLYHLINDYKESIQADKVIIVGLYGNGGFMSINLAINYEDEFAGYVHINEGYEDSLISDDQINSLSIANNYFIYSIDDESLDHELYSISTIERIIELGTDTLHVSSIEHIYSNEGYLDDDGNPYEYNVHNAHISFFNNQVDCDICGISVYEWMEELKS